MKKLVFPIIAMLLGMAACNKDNEGILKLEVDPYAADAKAHLDDENYVVWDDDDQVKVNGTDYNVVVSPTSATIADVPEADNYTAVYPASWANASGSGVTYPEIQTYRKNSDGDQVVYAPMAAYSTGGTLTFHNLGSILAVTVTNSNSEAVSVRKIEVVAEDHVSINGTCSISGLTTDRPFVGSPSEGGSTTTLECNGESISAGGSKTFFIAMPPVETRLTIKVYDQYFVGSKTQASAHEMEVNYIYAAPIATTDNPVQYFPYNNQIFYTAFDELDLKSALTSSRPVADHTFSDGNGVITFKNNITSLPDNAFRELNVRTISLPYSVTTVGTSAFYQCDILKYVEMPSVTSVGAQAFQGCDLLKSVYMPSATTIGTNAFYGCTSLEFVDLPSATSIGTSAFYNCSSFASVKIPLVASIESGAFWNCYNLTSVEMPSVTAISAEAFKYCYALKTINLYGLASLEEGAFEGCTLNVVNWYASAPPSSVTAATFGTVAASAKLHVLSGSDVTEWTTWRGTDYFQGADVAADLTL